MMQSSSLISFLLALLATTGSAFVVPNHLALAATITTPSFRLEATPTTTSTSATDTDTDTDEDENENEDDQAVLSSPMFINESEELSKRPASSLSPEKMILIAKRFLTSSGGLGGDPAMLSESFTFEGPVVGPLPKDEFVQAIGSVDFSAAFPDFTSEFYGFHVDPFEGDRVWYTARGKGKNTGPLVPFVPEKSGTGKTVVNPPQVCSITIEHSTGLISKYTIGYVVDRTVGNTGGLGGLYGILYALGRPLPFPEANPWQKSLPYTLFQKIGGLIQKWQ